MEKLTRFLSDMTPSAYYRAALPVFDMYGIRDPSRWYGAQPSTLGADLSSTLQMMDFEPLFKEMLASSARRDNTQYMAQCVVAVVVAELIQHVAAEDYEPTLQEDDKPGDEPDKENPDPGAGEQPVPLAARLRGIDT